MRREWVEENPGLVNSGDSFNTTALSWAVQNDYPMLATWLLEEKGADVSLMDMHFHMPLYDARSAEMITVLVSHGADVAKSSIVMTVARLSCGRYGKKG